jgi:hypothetical protein
VLLLICKQFSAISKDVWKLSIRGGIHRQGEVARGTKGVGLDEKGAALVLVLVL